MAQQATDKADQKTEKVGGVVLARGVKLVGEIIAPGSSLILDGEVIAGGAHLIGGVVARAVLGPVGWFLVAANSYSKSVTGKHLHENLTSG